MESSKSVRLMVMMFIQYLMQGAWGMTLGLTLNNHGMADSIGTAYSLLGLSTILTPLLVGMITDRFFAAQKVMGLLHLVNAAVMMCIPHFIEAQNTTMTLATIFVLGLLYQPTGVLANSISFKHINGEKLYPIVRLCGSFGFILIGIIIGQLGYSGHTVTLYISAAAAAVLGLYCFTLPNTPPESRGKPFSVRDLLFLDAFSLFKDRNFSILMFSLFVLMIPKTAYAGYVTLFLQALGFNNAASLIQVGTVAEVTAMAVVSFVLLRVGFKTTLMFGLACWIIRMLFFAYASVDSVLVFVLIGLVLHGLCWDFFFIVADIYVDRKAKAEIRAQAQSLRFIVANGVGTIFGSTVCGLIFSSTLMAPGKQALSNWQGFWLISAAVAAVVTTFFLIFFKDDLARSRAPAGTAAADS